jgi:hypothetical protein
MVGKTLVQLRFAVKLNRLYARQKDNPALRKNLFRQDGKPAR